MQSCRLLYYRGTAQITANKSIQYSANSKNIQIWTISPPLQAHKAQAQSLSLAGAPAKLTLNWRNNMSNKTPMTPQAAARIQSSTANQNGGTVTKGSFAAKAQSAAAKNSGNGKKGGK